MTKYSWREFGACIKLESRFLARRRGRCEIINVMLLWNEKLATGSPVIDEQHRELIRHLNAFEGMLIKTNPTTQDIAIIIEFLDFLEKYVDAHFSYEEDCMERYRCPVHQKNVHAHQQFRDLFQKFKLSARKEGFRLPMLTELNQVINVWIQEHILAVDTTLKPCLVAAA